MRGENTLNRCIIHINGGRLGTKVKGLVATEYLQICPLVAIAVVGLGTASLEVAVYAAASQRSPAVQEMILYKTLHHTWWCAERLLYSGDIVVYNVCIYWCGDGVW